MRGAADGSQEIHGFGKAWSCGKQWLGWQALRNDETDLVIRVVRVEERHQRAGIRENHNFPCCRFFNRLSVKAVLFASDSLAPPGTYSRLCSTPIEAPRKSARVPWELVPLVFWRGTTKRCRRLSRASCSGETPCRRACSASAASISGVNVISILYSLHRTGLFRTEPV
jgi:hypothetical protein